MMMKIKIKMMIRINKIFNNSLEKVKKNKIKSLKKSQIIKITRKNKLILNPKKNYIEHLEE